MQARILPAFTISANNCVEKIRRTVNEMSKFNNCGEKMVQGSSKSKWNAKVDFDIFDQFSKVMADIH